MSLYEQIISYGYSKLDEQRTIQQHARKKISENNPKERLGYLENFHIFNRVISELV